MYIPTTQQALEATCLTTSPSTGPIDLVFSMIDSMFTAPTPLWSLILLVLNTTSITVILSLALEVVHYIQLDYDETYMRLKLMRSFFLRAIWFMLCSILYAGAYNDVLRNGDCNSADLDFGLHRREILPGMCLPDATGVLRRVPESEWPPLMEWFHPWLLCSTSLLLMVFFMVLAFVLSKVVQWDAQAQRDVCCEDEIIERLIDEKKLLAA